MNRQGGGYTIIEVIIFLAVSSALLISAVIVIGGQQSKAQFSQTMRELEGSIRDVINDVGEGLYKNPIGYTCDVIGGLGNATITPTFQSATAGSDQAGRNVNCIFLGKVVHFYPDSTTSYSYNIYDVVGRRFNSLGNEVTTIDEANPRTVTQNKTTLAQAETTETFPVAWRPALTSTIPTNTTGLAVFYSSLGSNANTSGLLGGSQVVRLGLVGQNATAIGTSKNLMTDQVDLMTSLTMPASGLQLCFSGGRDQKALLTIGENGASAVKLDFDNTQARTLC